MWTRPIFSTYMTLLRAQAASHEPKYRLSSVFSEFTGNTSRKLSSLAQLQSITDIANNKFNLSLLNSILKFIFLIKLLWVQWEGYFAEYVEYLWINVI